ncbi:MAG: hypothetical protein KAS62_03675, partial [Candidatus Delongbacteria bacterium]|nr:hypothetical protein [Candidatus Delongbacteria bacterium]
MKNIIILMFISSFFLFGAISQQELVEIENKGYLTNQTETEYGIIATNNLDNALYLIENGKITTLLENPVCGRYFNTFQNLIGFKYIDIRTSEQSPALYDLNTNRITYLAKPSSKCGQVSFSDKGDIAYTVENTLFVKYKSKKILEYELGTYSNITQISPDGNKVCYHDKDQNLFILDLLTLKTSQITEVNGFFDQKWSSDSKKIAYRDISGKLFIHNLISENTEDYDVVNSYNWDNNSIHYSKFIHDEESLISTDFYKLDTDTNLKTKITSTFDIYEFDLNLKPIEIAAPKQKATLNVPYIHQVYDTDSYAHRYGCCAATACV